MIKIKEGSSGNVHLISSNKEEEQQDIKYPIIIKGKSLRHSFFVIKKE
ncbi:MAG: hypothetical protein ACTHJ7_02925 [Candidatus Nitrosocosmicus sp.]